MKKLLIAQADFAFSTTLAERFREEYAVRTCTDGEAALDALGSFGPDMLVLDLMLPKKDGMAVLEALRQRGMHPSILVLSAFVSTYILNRLQTLGVDYVMPKPCQMDDVEARIQDLLAMQKEHAAMEPVPQDLMASTLLQMGFSPKLSGFRFLLSAIPMYAGNPDLSITKELYTALDGKNGHLVERSIRSAIEKAWETGNHVLWRQLFGAANRPSNGTFIARMAQMLKAGLDGEFMA